MSLDLQRTAAEVVERLMAQEGIDGAIVILGRNKDDMMALSMGARDVSVDSMIAAVVQLLGRLRAKALQDAAGEKPITVSN